MSTYTYGSLRAEIEEACREGEAPTGSEEKRFVAEFWAIDGGLEQVIDELQSKDTSAMVTKLIKDAIGDVRHSNALRLGLLIVEIAEDYARREYDELVETFLEGQPDYGYDEPEVRRVALDRA